MNRQQRRRVERQTGAKPAETLKEYLSKPDMVARRGEVFNVALRACEIHRLERIRQRWYYRLLRKIIPEKRPETQLVEDE